MKTRMLSLGLCGLFAAHSCAPHHLAPATRSLDGPTTTESIATGVPVAAGDYDGDGCVDPWQRVDTDPKPNSSDYCMWVDP